MKEALVEIITIGSELLIGKILNANAQWLARRCTTLGLKVRRIIVVGDNLNEIIDVIKESLKRKPKFIITTGGLGPTPDDLTLEAIAKALGRKLEINENALEMVKKAYLKLAEEGVIDTAELTPHRIKMATIPEGGVPLPNPVGAAPGVSMEVDGTTIVALPGVPSEMKAIFEEHVKPMLMKTVGELTYFEVGFVTYNIVESVLAPALEEIMRNNPLIYVKSLPRKVGRTFYVELYLSTTAKTTEEAKKRIGKAVMQLSELIRKVGGSIKPL